MNVTLLRADGTDLDVVNAARCSFGKRHETFYPAKDTRLIHYLARCGHWSPFAHVGLSLHVKAPIFVERQLFKHVVGLVANSVSRRYVDTPPEVHVPKWRERADDKKQGSGPEMDESRADWANEIQAEIVPQILSAYRALLLLGVAPEQARGILPLATITEFVWTGSLHAFARVCRLRLAPDAQAETREVARQIAAIAAERFPVSWAALMGGAS